MAFAHELSAKLATSSRHVCVFLGAGASKACGLPDVSTLEQQILSDLEPEERDVFEHQLQNRNLEQALSRLRRIAALVEGDDTVDGLDASKAGDLDRRVCHLIVQHLEIGSNVDVSPAAYFAAWAGRTQYTHPLEIFSVNYDLLAETALEQLGVPYFDGFVGSLHARFRTDLVEAVPGDEDSWLPRFLVRLWKLHGSVNWAWEEGPRREVVRLGSPVGTDTPAAIYPSDTKYDESRRVPFVVLQDRLRRALHQPETLLLVSGYSWTDEHLNEMLFDAATRRPRSEIVALCYSTIPDVLAEWADVTPNLQVVTADEAILGGVRGEWRAPNDDEAPPPDVWEDDKLVLGDFSRLARFLAHSSSGHGELRVRLDEVLSRLVRETDE